VHLQQLQLAFCLLSKNLDKDNKLIPINTRTTPTKVRNGVSTDEMIDSPNQAKPDNIKK